jgi:hypothetical protein
MAKKTKTTKQAPKSPTESSTPAAVVSTIRNPFPPAKVAPLTLEQRAQLGDQEAAQAIASPAKETGNESAKSAPKAKTKPTAKTATKPVAKAQAKVKTVAAKAKPAKEKKLGALSAAAKVLGETNQPMTSREMIDAMSAKGYWTSPNGQTPEATLYAAIIREIRDKGKASRFAKSERGKFEATGV